MIWFAKRIMDIFRTGFRWKNLEISNLQNAQKSEFWLESFYNGHWRRKRKLYSRDTWASGRVYVIDLSISKQVLFFGTSLLISIWDLSDFMQKFSFQRVFSERNSSEKPHSCCERIRKSKFF